MPKKKKVKDVPSAEMGLNPELRPAEKFDSTGIAKFPAGDGGDMGAPVQDNCAEEHIM